MKKMINLVAMLVAVTLTMAMPVMAATRSEDNRTSWQDGQFDIATEEIRNNEIDVEMHVKKPDDTGDRSYDMVIRTPHYRWNVYYTSATHGYGSLYFSDGTFIMSLNDDDLAKTSF